MPSRFESLSVERVSREHFAVRHTQLRRDAKFELDQRQRFRTCVGRTLDGHVAAVPGRVRFIQQEGERCPVVIDQQMRHRCAYVPLQWKSKRLGVLLALYSRQLTFKLKNRLIGGSVFLSFAALVFGSEGSQRSLQALLCRF